MPDFTKVDLSRLKNASAEITQELAERLIETFMSYHRELKAKNGNGLRISEIIVGWCEAHAGILDSLVAQTKEESLVETSLAALIVLAMSRRTCDCESCSARRKEHGLERTGNQVTVDDFGLHRKPNRHVH